MMLVLVLMLMLMPMPTKDVTLSARACLLGSWE
jgi:hypothetical protein